MRLAQSASARRSARPPVHRWVYGSRRNRNRQKTPHAPRAEREREAQRAAAKAAAELEAEAAAAHMERGGGASTSPADSATDSYWTYGSSLPSNPSVRWAALSTQTSTLTIPLDCDVT